jgi:hypothetical protein
MKTVKINTRQGSRDCQQVQILLVAGRGIVQFKGESIAPVCRVTDTTYTKDGKWSHTTWTVELADGCQLISHFQDFGTGKYFNSNDWIGAVEELLCRFGSGQTPADYGLTHDQVVRAIRTIFPRSAAAIDAAEQSWSAAGDQLADLLAAQEEHTAALSEAGQVVADIEATEESKRLRQQSAALKAAAAAVKGSKMSLADLKALMGQ